MEDQSVRCGNALDNCTTPARISRASPIPAGLRASRFPGRREVRRGRAGQDLLQRRELRRDDLLVCVPRGKSTAASWSTARRGLLVWPQEVFRRGLSRLASWSAARVGCQGPKSRMPDLLACAPGGRLAQRVRRTHLAGWGSAVGDSSARTNRGGHAFGVSCGSLSPATKRPGWLGSRKSGPRASGHAGCSMREHTVGGRHRDPCLLADRSEPRPRARLGDPAGLDPRHRQTTATRSSDKSLISRPRRSCRARPFALLTIRP